MSPQPATRPQGAVVVAATVMGMATFSVASQLFHFWRYGVALGVALLAVGCALFGWAAGYTARRNDERSRWGTAR